MWERESRAERFLDDWLARARRSKVEILYQQLAQTLSGHREGLLASYDCPISTGPLEGTNTKVKLMQRQAYGFRDHEFFKLKILPPCTRPDTNWLDETSLPSCRSH